MIHFKTATEKQVLLIIHHYVTCIKILSNILSLREEFAPLINIIGHVISLDNFYYPFELYLIIEIVALFLMEQVLFP